MKKNGQEKKKEKKKILTVPGACQHLKTRKRQAYEHNVSYTVLFFPILPFFFFFSLSLLIRPGCCFA